MVKRRQPHNPPPTPVSVLALSSRFDGRLAVQVLHRLDVRFSTRSVESF